MPGICILSIENSIRKHPASSRSNAIECSWVGYVNVSHEMDSNLNTSPEMSYGVLECDIVVTELHAYDFVIKDLVQIISP